MVSTESESEENRKTHRIDKSNTVTCDSTTWHATREPTLPRGALYPPHAAGARHRLQECVGNKERQAMQAERPGRRRCGTARTG
eukprot:7260827-Pyramimonas_sp.AAC.1